MPIPRRLLLLAPFAAAPFLAARGTAHVFTADGAAIRGADPVAYHRLGRPVAGNAAITHAWSGATWRFADAAHRDAFAAEPERFAPAYGGFCAWAVSQGYTAPIDPDAWRIVDGRLYLNYDRAVQRQWERDIPGHIRRADANWPRLRQAARPGQSSPAMARNPASVSTSTPSSAALAALEPASAPTIR